MNEERDKNWKQPLYTSWSEQSGAEKIETLRREVMTLQQIILRALEQANRAKAMAERHEHGHDGKPLFESYVLEQREGQTSRINPLL